MANCGQHTELASNDAVKITRCSCGTVHMTMHATGVTVRISTEALRAVTIGMKAAVERLDAGKEPTVPTGTGRTTIN